MEIEIRGHSGCQIDIVNGGDSLFINKSTRDKNYIPRLYKQALKQCNASKIAYQQIRVVAWSMGVWVAERVLQGITLQSATAVNGTGLPCDDSFGIPYAIFKGTLENLEENTRSKFERRICGDKVSFERYQQFSARPFNEIHQELTALFAMIQQDKRTDLIHWTNTWISSRDKIFIPANQHQYWASRCGVQERGG